MAVSINNEEIRSQLSKNNSTTFHWFCQFADIIMTPI